MDTLDLYAARARSGFITQAANELGAAGLQHLTLSKVVYKLRFPGQYYDAENGLHSNYFRDYDRAVGRYIESDPIGLKGGLNTYAYATDAPVLFTDRSGLATTVRCGPVFQSAGSTGFHCEVVATCEKTGERIAFGIGGGGDTTFQRLFSGKIPPKYDNSAPPTSEGRDEYTADCGRDGNSCGCKQLECFKRMHASNNPPPYFALSQNSNTYAHTLLAQCGCSLSATPHGAVAWDNVDYIPVGP